MHRSDTPNRPPPTADQWAWAMENRGLAHAVANRCRRKFARDGIELTQEDMEDLDQDLLLALVRGKQGYDPGKGADAGATLETYATRCATFASIDWAHRKWREIRENPTDQEEIERLPDEAWHPSPVDDRDVARIMADPQVMSLPARARAVWTHTYSNQPDLFFGAEGCRVDFDAMMVARMVCAGDDVPSQHVETARRIVRETEIGDLKIDGAPVTWQAIQAIAQMQSEES